VEKKAQYPILKLCVLDSKKDRQDRDRDHIAAMAKRPTTASCMK
jgi:hypothetical protein